MTPRQIALDTLNELGETPQPDPITQLRTLAREAITAFEHADLPEPLTDQHGQPTPAVLAYERIADRACTAAVAAVRVDQAEHHAAVFAHAADLLEAHYATEAKP